MSAGRAIAHPRPEGKSQLQRIRSSTNTGMVRVVFF